MKIQENIVCFLNGQIGLGLHEGKHFEPISNAVRNRQGVQIKGAGS